MSNRRRNQRSRTRRQNNRPTRPSRLFSHVANGSRRIFNTVKPYIAIFISVPAAIFFFYLQGSLPIVIAIATAVAGSIIGYIVKKTLEDRQFPAQLVNLLGILLATSAFVLWLTNTDFAHKPCLARPGEKDQPGEALMLITDFTSISGNTIEPDQDWEYTLSRYVPELNEKYGISIRVLSVKGSMSLDQTEAEEQVQALIKCYQSPFVIWGYARSGHVNAYLTYSEYGVDSTSVGSADIQGSDTQLRLQVGSGETPTQYADLAAAMILMRRESKDEVQQGIELLDSIMKSFPATSGNEINTVALLVEKAKAYISIDEFGLAMTTLDKALAIDKNNLYVHIVLAEAYWHGHDWQTFEEALNASNTAMSEADLAVELAENWNHIDQASAYMTRCTISKWTSKLDSALADCNAAINIAGPSYFYLENRADVSLRLAATEFAMGNNRQGKKHVRNAMRDIRAAGLTPPNRGSLLLYKGQALTMMGRLSQARGLFNRIITKYPDQLADAHLGLGQVYFLMGDINQAIAEFSNTIIIEPNHINAYYNRGTLRYEIGYQQADLDMTFLAISDLQKAVELYPLNPDALLNLANCYLVLAQSTYITNNAVIKFPDAPTKAEELLKQALEIRQDDPNIYNSLGGIYFLRNDLPVALEYFNLALRFDDSNINAYNNRARVYQAMGEQGLADADLERVRELEQNP